MNKKITLILFLIISIIILNIDVKAETSKNLVNIYFFHSNTCSHCKEETKFLNTIEKKYSNIKIYKYEIHEEDNQKILKKVEELHNIKINSVPLTIIGNEVYTGFSEKSKIKFIKTIEYFSNYGYKDKIGEYLELELPTYEPSSNDIELSKFIDIYHNYKILGLSTDNLDTPNIALLLGLLLSCNIISIIGIILVSLISKKIKKDQNQILLLMIYIGLNTVLLLKSLIDHYIFMSIIYLLIIITIIYSILKITNKNKQYIYLIFTILISTVVNILITYLDNQSILIFKNLLTLHNLTGLNKISYYSNCLIINITINLLITYIMYISLRRKRNSI